jgi:DNA polymerase-3 subunit epsilon
MYAIIDIETTGLNHKAGKITEIAVFVHDGNKITDEFSTLINPERNIPYAITSITGITNEMVSDAPKFYEIAKRIVELTENKIFVAHNANFDYRFICEEFMQLGYKFRRELLCTVKMSRKILPGKASYNLDSLCSCLNIKIKNRHRAAGDAIATVKLLEILLAQNANQSGEFLQGARLSKQDINKALDVAIINNLTNETGVYYFYNEKGDVIYVGKGNDIYHSVLTHFNKAKTKKALTLKSQIADIDYEVTGSELISCIAESENIGKINPCFNHSDRLIQGLIDFGHESFWIIDSGRCPGEQSVIAIIDGQYSGYGFISNDLQIVNKYDLNDCIKSSTPSDEVHCIIKKYLKDHPRMKIIR